MANTSSAKGNPASHRMSNPNNKARRVKNSAKNADKNKHDGKIGKSNLSNYKKNEKLQMLKKKNYGLGQREVRRILSEKNTGTNLTGDQIAELTLLGHSFNTIYNGKKSE